MARKTELENTIRDHFRKQYSTVIAAMMAYQLDHTDRAPSNTTVQELQQWLYEKSKGL